MRHAKNANGFLHTLVRSIFFFMGGQRTIDRGHCASDAARRVGLDDSIAQIWLHAGVCDLGALGGVDGRWLEQVHHHVGITRDQIVGRFWHGDGMEYRSLLCDRGRWRSPLLSSQIWLDESNGAA